MQDKIEQAMLRGSQLLIENGLGDWRVKVNNKRTSLAETWHKEKMIVFSKKFIMISTKEQFEGVALHEIAHALLGRGHGHDEKFVELCTKISGHNKYAQKSTTANIGRYMFSCPSCGQTASHNSNKDKYCGICFKNGETVKFNMRINKLEVRQW